MQSLTEMNSTYRSMKSGMDAKVAVFLGIPFASPPMGSLRFMPPVASSPWKGAKNANRFAPVCPQEFPKEMNNRLDKIKYSSLYFVMRSPFCFSDRQPWGQCRRRGSENCINLKRTCKTRARIAYISTSMLQEVREDNHFLPCTRAVIIPVLDPNPDSELRRFFDIP